MAIKNTYTELQTKDGNITVLRIIGRKHTTNVIIDNDMVAELKQYTWHDCKRDKVIRNENGENIRKFIYGKTVSSKNIITTVNRDYLDNRLENLIEVSGQKELQEFCNVHRDNKLGIKGVCETKTHFIAHIKRDNIRIIKKFSKRRLGNEVALQNAINERKRLEELYD